MSKWESCKSERPDVRPEDGTAHRRCVRRKGHDHDCKAGPFAWRPGSLIVWASRGAEPRFEKMRPGFYRSDGGKP